MSFDDLYTRVANNADLVFLRAWYSIEPKKLYNPVTSLLLADKKDWQGMRLVGQIRKDQGIDTPSDPNSAYKVSDRAHISIRWSQLTVRQSHVRPVDSTHSKSHESSKLPSPTPPRPSTLHPSANKPICNPERWSWIPRRRRLSPSCSRSNRSERIKWQDERTNKRRDVKSIVKKRERLTSVKLQRRKRSVGIDCERRESSESGKRRAVVRAGAKSRGPRSLNSIPLITPTRLMIAADQPRTKDQGSKDQGVFNHRLDVQSHAWILLRDSASTRMVLINPSSQKITGKRPDLKTHYHSSSLNPEPSICPVDQLSNQAYQSK